MVEETKPTTEAIPLAATGSLAKLFHETYERLAPEYGYRTREQSAVPWEDVPDKNKLLMIATAKVVLETWQPDVSRLASILGPVAHPDVRARLGEIALELKHMDGEHWAVGKMVEQARIVLDAGYPAKGAVMNEAHDG